MMKSCTSEHLLLYQLRVPEHEWESMAVSPLVALQAELSSSEGL